MQELANNNYLEWLNPVAALLLPAVKLIENVKRFQSPAMFVSDISCCVLHGNIISLKSYFGSYHTDIEQY